jgi:hypothetical protein
LNLPLAWRGAIKQGGKVARGAASEKVRGPYDS